MKRFLLDTGIAGDYLNRRKVFDRAKAEVARGNTIGICIPVLGELYAGMECSSSRDMNIKKLHRALAVWTLWPFSEDAAWEYGKVFAELRQLGDNIGQVDKQIAAIARSLGNCTVVSSDGDLAKVPGLSVENWAI